MGSFAPLSLNLSTVHTSLRPVLTGVLAGSGKAFLPSQSLTAFTPTSAALSCETSHTITQSAFLSLFRAMSTSPVSAAERAEAALTPTEPAATAIAEIEAERVPEPVPVAIPPMPEGIDTSLYSMVCMVHVLF
ncbi:hypothetical protein KIPB_013741 [Kipferlia bialata]|uniref:Uncharacterized protein n=1 Tax=Kipferlia bialata TaxID=797122 RepID=A0A9K3GQJ0_9EUKA|nr:hypothetical protein KIPB_013741 [Kipferlia bialata]|eukprot:g13741.t1